MKFDPKVYEDLEHFLNLHQLHTPVPPAEFKKEFIILKRNL